LSQDFTDSAGSGGNGEHDFANTLPAEGGGGHKWDRNSWSMWTIRGPSANSSWNDVTIPFSKIEFSKQSLIGRGRFGEVLTNITGASVVSVYY
jgi:hypothetical protein